MKKTLFAFVATLAVTCCALAYALSGQSTLTLPVDTGASEKVTSSAQKNGEASISALAKGDLQIDPQSLNMLLSRVPSKADSKAMRKAPADQENVKDVTVDLWNTVSTIYPYLEGDYYDAETNTLTFSVSENTSNHFFSGATEDMKYAWYADVNQTYQFSGTLTSDSYAVISVLITYILNENRYYNDLVKIVLNEDNGFTSNFELSSANIDTGSPLEVCFSIEEASASQTFTSTNNQFFYTYRTSVANKWTEETDLPGLGCTIDPECSYTVLCEDGVTTLGLYYDGGDEAYITGINTTASEVTLPECVTINGAEITTFHFGSQDLESMDWSGAPALTHLDATTVNTIQKVDFGNSAVTDLYVSGECNYIQTSGQETIYLHIPYSADREDFAHFGFKRVLKGYEEPSYPETEISGWVIAGENEGDYFGIVIRDGYYTVAEVFTERDSITFPVVTPYDGIYSYYIRIAGTEDYAGAGSLCKNAPALKSITIPERYTNIYIDWNSNPIVDLHMQGDVPKTNNSLYPNMTVYVGNKAYFDNYENNSNWNQATIVPDGWEFEWMTINVGRKGEFAQTYIEMTDADWSLGQYVKVTGALNDSDLNNIKKLTSLKKLDLSEAEFTSLPESFLEGKTTLKEVTLPENLTVIPNSAFRACTALSVVNCSGVTSVGNYAFYGCSALSAFDLSKTQTVGYYAFYNCESLNHVDFSAMTYIGSRAFQYTAIEEAVFAEGLRIIADYAFYDCTHLTNVVIPSTVYDIQTKAFYGCSALESIVLPEGVQQIGNSAFEDCTNLAEITLPSTLQSIGYGTFSVCRKLTAVKCKAIVPPVASGVFTSSMDLNHCTLYVAPFTIDAYREAEYWNNFYIMKPLNEPVKNIYVNRPMKFDLLSEDNEVLQDNPNITLDYKVTRDGYYNTIINVGQLSASGDGTLSAGVFTILHRFNSRDNGNSDYRTTLINDAENMRADSVICSIQFEKNMWHFISFQYDVQMQDIFGMNNTDFVIRQYNSINRASGDGTTSNWENVPSDGVLKAGKGYIIQAANNSTYSSGSTYSAIVRFPSRNTVTKNNLFTSNNIIVPLEEYPAEFAHNRSWNLVGNPYPCYYDMHYLMDDFTTPIVLWRSDSYQAYSPIDDEIILRPNEAFFVQRPLDAEQMVFGADGRMHYDAAKAAQNGGATPGIKAPAQVPSSVDRAVFNFNIAGCGSDDRARIVMNENASLDYEISRDASKFFSEQPQGAEIYVDGAVKYDICERPLAEGVASLGMRIAAKGEYTLSLAGRDIAGWQVTLTDTKTGACVDLTAEAYTFEAEVGTIEGRFLLSFISPEPTSIDDIALGAEDANVRVVNVAGITVYEGSLKDFKTTAPAGVYIVVSAEKAYKVVVK